MHLFLIMSSTQVGRRVESLPVIAHLNCSSDKLRDHLISAEAFESPLSMRIVLLPSSFSEMSNFFVCHTLADVGVRVDVGNW